MKKYENQFFKSKFLCRTRDLSWVFLHRVENYIFTIFTLKFEILRFPSIRLEKWKCEELLFQKMPKWTTICKFLVNFCCRTRITSAIKAVNHSNRNFTVKENTFWGLFSVFRYSAMKRHHGDSVLLFGFFVYNVL